MPNSKPPPNHPGWCNGPCRTTISTIPISRRSTINLVLTTQNVQQLIPYNDQYRTYLLNVNSNPRSHRSVGRNGPYRTTISTGPISRRRAVHQVQTTRIRTMAVTIQRSVSYPSPDAEQQTTFQTLGWVPNTRLGAMAMTVHRSVYCTNLPTPIRNLRADHSVCKMVITV